jgi:hypothetical protein
MFLDTWTRGGLVADREALRLASGDTVGGSNLNDLQRGVAAYAGIDLRFSPYGGDRLGWAEFLDRLAQGGGAVVLGWYSLLPDRYTRWDRAFAAKGTGASGHAMFVTDYRPSTDQLWLMDPLGRGDYRGEWIPAPDLRRFVWTARDGAIYGAVTPPPQGAAGGRPTLRPFAGFGFGPPVVMDAPQTGATVELAVPVGDALGAVAARFPRVRVQVEFTPLGAVPEPPVDDAVGEAADVEPGPIVHETTPAADEPQMVDPTAQGDGLRALVRLPAIAGLYRMRATLVDPDGHDFPSVDRPHIPGAIVLVEDHPAVRAAPDLVRPDIPLLVIPTPTPSPTYEPPTLPSDPSPAATPAPTAGASPSPTSVPTSPSPSPTPSPTIAPPTTTPAPTPAPSPSPTPTPDPPTPTPIPTPVASASPTASPVPSEPASPSPIPIRAPMSGSAHR